MQNLEISWAVRDIYIWH